MSAPRAPSLEPRRQSDFASELRERARTWIPSWGLADGERDFGRALLEVAARLSAEVAEHLDRAGGKMARGFLDWLAVRGTAARSARMPVVFKLTDSAPGAVSAPAPARLQAGAVVFETETDVRLVAGRLELVVGVDAGADAYYLPPPGLTSLDPVQPLPTQWRVKSFAAAGATKLQLDPALGLAAQTILEIAGQQYRIVKVENDIVTIDPPLPAGDGVAADTAVRQVAAFAPFDAARNRQSHALYLGHSELLNLEAPATIEVVGAQTLGDAVAWQYWGKVDGSDAVAWQPLTLADAARRQADAVVLVKPKGAVETCTIGAVSSRWIRAFKATVDAGAPMLQADALQLRVNCSPSSVPCPPSDTSPDASPATEAMANNTPLALTSVFYPLGRQPRQFDAFYLGCAEALSKKNAQVQLCFQMADPTFAALAAVRGGMFANSVLAGVGADSALHLLAFDPASGTLAKFRDREPLQPPGTTLDPSPAWRLPVWCEGNDFRVAVTAGDTVWVWHESAASQTGSAWVSLGPVPGAAQGGIEGLAYLNDSATPLLVALRDGMLAKYELGAGAQWSQVQAVVGTANLVLKAIAPVLVPAAVAPAAPMNGLVGIAGDFMLYEVAIDGSCTKLSQAATPSEVTPEIQPVAIEDAGQRVVVAVNKARSGLVALDQGGNEATLSFGTGAEVVGSSLEATVSGGRICVLASVRNGQDGSLASWAPFATGPAGELYEAAVPAGAGQIGGAPTVLPKYVVIPGTRADALVAEFDLANRQTVQTYVEAGIALSASTPSLLPGDHVAVDMELRRIADYGLAHGGEMLYPLVDPYDPFGIGATSSEIFAYRTTAPDLTGTIAPSGKLELGSNDLQTQVSSILFVDGALRQVTDITAGVAALDPALPGPVATSIPYWRPLSTGGRVAPYMPIIGNWDPALLERATLRFPGLTLTNHRGRIFTDPGIPPAIFVLGVDWTQEPSLPAGATSLVADAAVGAWARRLGDASSNPELSWEYWDGKGWSKLTVDLDATLNLKATGVIRFTVPADLKQGDWAGKTNYWIRARLIGGDYGHEQVTVTSTPTTGGGTVQTVTRSAEGISPPLAVHLYVSYSFRDPVTPTYVLAEDSGSILDQSDANRTAGAIVEAFVPLATALGRLDAAATTSASQECPPDCGCASAGSSAAATVPSSADQASGAAPQASGRALYLGFDARLSGEPVNVLLLVEQERALDSLAPLGIAALVGDRFRPLVAEDTTRAAGESGLLSLAFPVEPTPKELFGRSLTWLRLAPAKSDATTAWQPSLRGVYLNAVWARAAETLTRELLGSSEGMPKLTLQLARPPLLHDTLELRVKEPLGEEERVALLEDDPARVLSNVADLPGDWVRWSQVPDPDDCGPAERVYALDEASGMLRFGDGLHGVIPPIGRDSIVAFSYRRTDPAADGGDVPANAIAARSPLNLVTPVEGVEAAFAADQAAGGAGPESVERVLRFGSARLRHRGRALTAHDFEDLARELFVDIVQARCFVRQGYVKLAIVVRGPQPQPSAAVRREVGRALLELAAGSLGAPQALRVEGPTLRRLRVALRLRVAGLDRAGEVSRDAKRDIASLFDSATGGVRQEGWPLGATPAAEDIAFALADVPQLEGIAGIELLEVAEDGSETPWRGTVKASELVVLAGDGVRIEFEIVEAAS